MERLDNMVRWLLYSSSIEDLRNVDMVSQKIGECGLVWEARRALADGSMSIYGDDHVYMLSREETLQGQYHNGLWQTPGQLAGALVHLSSQNIDSFVEIGTYAGWTCTVIVAYLMRFGLNSAYTYDVEQFCSPLTQTIWKNHNMPLVYLLNEPIPPGDYDLIFIDGNHEYPYVKADYEMYKSRARMLMFHDINDAYCPGVRQIWKEIKTLDPKHPFFVEFTQHPNGFELMGIGIVNMTK